MRARALVRVSWTIASIAFIGVVLAGLFPARLSADSGIGRPPSWADPFYAKYLDASGIAIMGSANVDDRALTVARDTVSRMLAKRPDLARIMAQQHAIVAISAANELMTDIPERRQYRGKIGKSGRSFDESCGGGAVRSNPVTTICERNLLNANAHFATLVHEFGHSIQNLALDSEMLAAIHAAYEQAQQKGLFRKADGQTPAYLMSNDQEFFADTTTMWFDGYDPANPHNTPFVSTRAQLRTYDPEIYRILAEIYPEDHWKPLW
jgi:hypothetical protein